MKKLKHVFIFAILAFLILAAYSFFTPKTRYYIKNYNGKIKIEVPDEIISNKNCDEYTKFVESLIRPGFVPDTVCPWVEIGSVGHFTISGMKLEIPREYIWYNSKQADGEIGGLNLMMKYPDFEAASASGDQSWNVKVSIQINKCFDEYSCEMAKWYKFRSATGLQKFDSEKKQFVFDDKYEPKLLKEHKDLGLSWYKYPYGFTTLVDDNPKLPNYWLDCGPKKNSHSRCKTEFEFNKKLTVNYSFKQKLLLKEHKVIRQKILAKINEFIVNEEVK